VAGRTARGARHGSGRPRSQHFLRSPRLAAAIVAQAGVGPGDLVLDVGAGSGRLTAALASRGAAVRAIELDPFWAARLRDRFAGAANVEVIEGDVLVQPLPFEPFRVVANLPFHLSTAILRRLLDGPEAALERADVIVEWEVARKRAVCWPSSLLDVVWGATYELAVVRRLPAACFEPRPAADAGVLRIERRPSPLVPAREASRFRAMVEAGFRTRAPVLRTALAPWVAPRVFKRVARELGFDASVAARDLDVHHWAALFDAVSRGNAETVRPLR
jgi:23S rRNA (adenine-N6)-dimethyltransferase